MPLTSWAEIKLLHIKLFCELMQTGNISETARALGINESKIKRTLATLREVSQDPLFERQGGSLVPTIKAKQLLPLMQKMVDLSGQVTLEQRNIAETEISIACVPQLLVGLPQIIKAHSPSHERVHLTLLGWNEHCEADLKAGNLSAVVAFRPTTQSGLISRPLTQIQGGYLLARDNHPIWSDYGVHRAIDFPLVRLSTLPFPANRSPLGQYAQSQGRTLPIYATVSDLSCVASILLESDAIIILGVRASAELLGGFQGIHCRKMELFEGKQLLKGFNPPTSYLWLKEPEEGKVGTPRWLQSAIEQHVMAIH